MLWGKGYIVSFQEIKGDMEYVALLMYSVYQIVVIDF